MSVVGDVKCRGIVDCPEFGSMEKRQLVFFAELCRELVEWIFDGEVGEIRCVRQGKFGAIVFDEICQRAEIVASDFPEGSCRSDGGSIQNAVTKFWINCQVDCGVGE